MIALVAVGLPPKAVMESRLRFRTSAQIEAGCMLLFIAVAATLASRFGVKALILGMLLRHGIEALLYWVFSSMRVADLFVSFDWASVKERLRFGSSMALQSLLGTSMRQADGLLVGFLAGPIVGGIYGQLQNLVVQPFAKLTLFVARAAFPTFARAKDDPDRLLRGLTKMQRLVALSVFPALVGMAAVAPRMLHVLLGEQYAEYLAGTVPAFQILCVGALVFTYGYSTGVALNAIGLSRRMLTRQALGGLSVLVLVAVGASWDLLGLSVGRALASAAIAFLYIDLARRVLGFSLRIAASGVREAAPAAIACFVAAWSVGFLGDRLLPASSALAGAGLGSGGLLWAVLLAQVLAGALAYAAALMLGGMRPAQEWRALRGET